MFQSQGHRNCFFIVLMLFFILLLVIIVNITNKKGITSEQQNIFSMLQSLV